MKQSNLDLAKMLKILGDYYGAPLEGTSAASYRVALEDFDVNWGKVTKVILQKFSRMPKAAEIISLVLPSLETSLTPKQRGIDLVSEIQKTVRECGWNNEKKAMENLSARAQGLVSSLGGWQKVCASDFTNPAFYAQARDLAETIAAKEKFSINAEMLSFAGAVVKNIHGAQKQGTLQNGLELIEGPKVSNGTKKPNDTAEAQPSFKFRGTGK